MRNELQKMQDEVIASKGGSPPELVDADGYSKPAAGPQGDPDSPTVSNTPTREVAPLMVGSSNLGNAPNLPVAFVDLAAKVLRGNIGIFPLDNDDVVAFTKLGQKVMLKAVEAICPPAPSTAKRKGEASDTTAPTQPDQTVLRAKATRNTRAGTKRKGAKKGTTRTTTKITAEQQQG